MFHSRLSTLVLAQLLCAGTLAAAEEETALCDTLPTKKNKLAAACSAMKVGSTTLPAPEAFRASVGFIYLMPTVDDTYFVTSAPISATYPNGTRENNNFSFAPGFRLGFETALCRNQRKFDLSYTYLNASQSKSVSGEHLWATRGGFFLDETLTNFLGSASSDSNLLYQQAEIVFSQQALDIYGLYFHLQPGFEGAYLRLNEKFQYIVSGSLSGNVHQKSASWGFGPKLAFQLDYNVFEGSGTCGNTSPSCMTHAVAVVTNFGAALLSGQIKTDTKAIAPSSSTTYYSVTDKHGWRVIPALHGRVGLNYTVHCATYGGTLEMGYEFDSYIRGVARTEGADGPEAGYCITNFDNFDLQGLYLSAAMLF